MKAVDSNEIKRALANKHQQQGDFFIAECKDGSTGHVGLRILDGLAIKKSYTRTLDRFIGYEIKVSRSDFQRDAKMYSYLELVNQLHIVTPTGLIDRTEVPTEMGLVWYNPTTQTFTLKKAAPKRLIEINTNMLLYIIFSRIESDRYPFHNGKEHYFEDWLADKMSNQELGCRVRSKLVNKLADITRYDYKATAASLREQLGEIERVCTAHGMSWGQKVENFLKNEFSRKYPQCFDDVMIHVKRIQEIIDKEKEQTAFSG
jgi:hypothetical protein